MKSNSIRDAARDAMRDVADRAGEQVQSVDLRERLTPVVDHAIQLAREQAGQAVIAAGQARNWASPRVEAAMEWAAPRVERGLQAAAPKVEAAADRVAPAVDAARDRIVDDLLPRLIEAVHAAGAAGAAATMAAGSAATAATSDAAGAATDTVSRGIESAARTLADATPTARAWRRRRRNRLVLLAALVTALAAGVAAFRRSRSQYSGWEDAPTAVASTTETGPVSDPVLSPTDAVTEAEAVGAPDLTPPVVPPADPATGAVGSDSLTGDPVDLGADADAGADDAGSRGRRA